MSSNWSHTMRPWKQSNDASNEAKYRRISVSSCMATFRQHTYLKNTRVDGILGSYSYPWDMRLFWLAFWPLLDGILPQLKGRLFKQYFRPWREQHSSRVWDTDFVKKFDIFRSLKNPNYEALRWGPSDTPHHVERYHVEPKLTLKGLRPP